MINEENILHEYETWSLEGLLKTRGHIEQARERLAWQGRYHEVELAVIERLLAEKQAQEHEDARTGLSGGEQRPTLGRIERSSFLHISRSQGCAGAREWFSRRP